MSKLHGTKRHRQASRGFTLIELLLVIAVIAILAALIAPGLARAKLAAEMTQCRNNLRQYGLALNMYADDFKCFPPQVMWDDDESPNRYWPERLAPYTRTRWRYQRARDFTSASIQSCPGYARIGADYRQERGAYGYNAEGFCSDDLGLGGKSLEFDSASPNRTRVKESQVTVPADMVAFGDAFIHQLGTEPDTGLPEVWGDNLFSPIEPFLYSLAPELGLHIDDPGGDFANDIKWVRIRHSGRWNIVFLDQHADTSTIKKLFNPRSDQAAQRFNRDHLPHPEVRNQW